MSVRKLSVMYLTCANVRTGNCVNSAEFQGETEKEAKFNAEYANWKFRKVRGKEDCLCPGCTKLTKQTESLTENY